MHCATHSRQNSSVASSEASGSGSGGGCLCEGSQEIVNAIRSPGATVKSEYVVSCLPYVCAVVSNHTESGPATATVRPSCLWTQGTIRP